VQILIYAYRGWYWRPVYDHVGLIAAQLCLAYSLDMLLLLMRWHQPSFSPMRSVLPTSLPGDTTR